MDLQNPDITSQESVKTKIFAEQVKILHFNLLSSIPANFICSVIIFIGLHHSPNGALISWWFTAVVLVSIFRYAAFYFYSRYPQNNLLFLYVFIFGMALSAALWGILDSFLMPNSLLQQMIIIVIIAGVTAGGIQTLNANLAASFIYVSLIVIPLVCWLFLQNGLTYSMLGIAMTTYVLFMLVTSMRGYKLLENVITLRYKNLALVENLSESNKKLLQSYKILEQNEHEMALINEMNETLRACDTLKEAYEVIYLTAKDLFTGLSGGLIILNKTSNRFEIINQWGSDQILKTSISMADCWALRKRNSYVVNDATTKTTCNHFEHLPAAYVCIPLIIQREVVGVLVLHATSKEALTEYNVEQIDIFCESMQLSLTSIKLHEMLYEQATHDDVTGLFNRRYLVEALKRELSLTVRKHKKLCIAMIDLDYFKRLNDVSGHEAGDEMLKFVSKVLKDNSRESDIACRYGGDEFILMLVDSDVAAITQRLERIRSAIKSGHVYVNDQLIPPITVSVGVAEAPLEGATVADILRAADEALYTAKQSGRDRIECANSVKSN